MSIFGLTGGLASGKSTVALMFQKLGAKVVDADKIAREVLEPGQLAYEKVIAAFGSQILQRSISGALVINRHQLAEIVFADSNARETLNAITHPEISKRSIEQLSLWAAQGASFIIYEAALLVETRRYQTLDGLIVVDLSEELQLKRAMARGLTQLQAQVRIQAQASRVTRRAVATWVIDNSGSLAETEQQVNAIFRQWTNQGTRS